MENSAVTYHKLIVDGLRYFYGKDLQDIERMDIVEYRLHMEVAQLKQEDERLKMNEQAFINQQAKATKKKNFEDFYGKTNKKNIRSIEREFFPEKFAVEDQERLERGKQFSQADLDFLR